MSHTGHTKFAWPLADSKALYRGGGDRADSCKHSLKRYTQYVCLLDAALNLYIFEFKVEVSIGTWTCGNPRFLHIRKSESVQCPIRNSFGQWSWALDKFEQSLAAPQLF